MPGGYDMTICRSCHDHLISTRAGGHLLKQCEKISICASEAAGSRSAKRSSLRRFICSREWRRHAGNMVCSNSFDDRV